MPNKAVSTGTHSGPTLSELPRVLAGRFRLDALLGRGGMGVVYGGVDLRSGEQVAVKVIRAPPDGDHTPIERFIREAKHTAKLAHPNVVQVVDLGRSAEGELYYAMEHVAGESLAHLLRREGRLSPERAVHIGRQVCAALAVAHAHGIVHRDIKPANIMIGRRGADADFVKVLDFGIARALDGETQVTATGMLVGTAEYMAPEQVLGTALDARADLYALGGTLYRMLTASSLFPNATAATLVYHHVHTAPEPPHVHAPELAQFPALERVVLRLLEKKPEQRYASAEQVASALSAALAAPAAVEPTAPSKMTVAPPLSSVESLELDLAPSGELAFRRCAICDTEASRFAARCATCGADLTSAEQQSYLRRVAASRFEPPPAQPAQPSAPQAREAPPRVHAVRTQPPAEVLPQRVAQFVRGLPATFFQRVMLYCGLGGGALWFFGLVGRPVGLVLVGLAGAATVALFVGNPRAGGE